MGTRRTGRLLAGVVTLGLLVAACGGDDDDDAGTEAATSTPSAGSSAAPSTDGSGPPAATTGATNATEDTAGTGTEDTAAAGPGDTAGAEAMSDATLTVAIGSDIGGLDPQSVPGTGGGNLPAYGPMFGGDGSGLLVIVDPETKEWLPGVAESWETSEDLLTWTFTLRDGVLFHDGTQLTAEDVKFSVDRMIGLAEYNPDYVSGSRSQFEPIVESVEVVDPLTAVFHLKKADPILPIRPLYLVPKAYVEEVGDDEFARQPIGIGPFKFGSWEPGNELVLERFDDFYLGWGDPSGFHVPYVKTLVQKIVPDDAARLAALQAGEVDLSHNMSADIAKQMDGEDGYQVFFMPGTQPMYFNINTNDETAPDGSPNPWRDARVREAANVAVDLDTIIGAILTGKELRTFGSATSGFGFPEGIEDQAFQYDPDRARELLAEAGYPDGFSTTMSGPIGRWPNSRPVMEAVAEYLAQVGIEVEIQEMQYQEYVTRIQQRTLPGLAFFGCTGGSDPGNNFRYCYVSDGSFSNGPAADTAGERDIQADIDAAVAASENEADRDARGELLADIIEQWYLNPRQLWLYEPQTPVIGSDSIEWTFRSNDLALPEYWNIRLAD